MNKQNIVERVLSLVVEVRAMPNQVYQRWIEGRAHDLTGLAMVQIAAMNEPESGNFPKDQLQREAAAIPLSVAYMLGRKDATQRFSRVLTALYNEVSRAARQVDRDDGGLRWGKIQSVISRAVRVYGWPESEKRNDPAQEALLRAELRKGGDDLDYILHDLRR